MSQLLFESSVSYVKKWDKYYEEIQKFWNIKGNSLLESQLVRSEGSTSCVSVL